MSKATKKTKKKPHECKWRTWVEEVYTPWYNQQNPQTTDDGGGNPGGPPPPPPQHDDDDDGDGG
jgi:hypothetical protein